MALSRRQCRLLCWTGSALRLRSPKRWAAEPGHMGTRLVPCSVGNAPSCRAPPAAPTPLLISHPPGFQLLSSSPFPRAWPIFFSFLHQHPFLSPTFGLPFAESTQCIHLYLHSSLSTGLPLDVFHGERRPSSPKEKHPLVTLASPIHSTAAIIFPSPLACLRPVLPGSLAQLQNLSSTYQHPATSTR